ncbi:MAG: hypothetical protein QM204_06740 [Bacillota bacterium]|jgi:hypothetical protein|nr:hypothetical protein [Bacillota bacterium]NLL26358.1 hypothetical protein [Erysipelotrichia bacterium]
MKNMFNKLFSVPGILIIVIISGLVVFLFFSKGKKEDLPMTGEHHYSDNPNAPKDIESLDLNYFSLRRRTTATEDSDFIYGGSFLEITLSIYDEKDEYLIRKAKDKVTQFQKLGYMLWLTVSNDTADDYVSFDIAVDKEFVEQFALLIRESGIIKLNGKVDWTDGIPVDAGQFILSAKYQTGEKLSISINGKAPSYQEENLFQKLKPLLIKKMIENNANYIPLLNYDRTIITPEELISSIYISQIHSTLLNTFNFNLKIDDNKAYLSGEFTDYDGTYNCESLQIDKSDLEIILNGFLSNRYVLVTDNFNHSNNIAILEDSTFCFYVYFHGIDEGFKPYYGTFDESAQDVICIFRYLVKKYSIQ